MFRRYTCTYCGEIADAKDHVTPHAISTLSSNRSYARSKVVPSCSECNLMLGVSGSNQAGEYTIASKAEFLLEHYSQCYRSYISGDKGDWTPAEVKEFGPTLREAVKSDIKMRKIIQERAEHLQRVIDRNPTIEEVWDEIAIDEGKKLALPTSGPLQACVDGVIYTSRKKLYDEFHTLSATVILQRLESDEWPTWEVL